MHRCHRRILNNPRGDFTIHGWDRPEVAVVGELDDLAKRLLFKVDDDVTIVRVVMSKRNVNWGDGSDLEIYVPRGAKLQIANLYRGIGKYDLADEWIDRARRLSDGNMPPAPLWAEVSVLAARGKREEIEAILRTMVSGTQANAETASNATLAAYFLEDSAAAIASWERAGEL